MVRAEKRPRQVQETETEEDDDVIHTDTEVVYRMARSRHVPGLPCVARPVPLPRSQNGAQVLSAGCEGRSGATVGGRPALPVSRSYPGHVLRP